ncbi:oxysterol-binding protein-related protein 6 isoform X1 [Megalobrama amblycephala]|uniref:oxysterol-binding protein-related protein 6 isoform X1 n=1 Tax=Megalobrama amblycephala TaxID=75352 RepID=UPI002013F621|nr:oxysterol-binding protein-related protein 6 isoform X1 [Megalobrama amblycephala]XP_048048803.1 oxysterol-binding protein-related protein 6 isoform X1 [Megalobrama amblycephala]XP_048048804.1 oxysterol-binding protein-related protein 6 isoform X1 [Megalobrama amblycephala]
MSRHHSRATSFEEKGTTPIHKSSTPLHKSSTPTHKSASSSSSSQRDSRQETDSWEIIEGLKIGQTHVQRPEKHEGFMLKKRKWPLKGWHKRFFVLDNGILKYSKSPVDIQKGKLHGSIDVGLSVMSVKKRARRIDLDTEEHIYHLKVKSPDVFDIWVCKLRNHRLFRQNEIVRSPRDATLRTFPPTAAAESPQNTPSSTHQNKQGKPSSLAWHLPPSCSNGQSKVAAWLKESEEMDKCAEELAYCQSSLLELSQLLQSLEILQRTQSAPNFTDMQSNCVDLTKKEKRVSRRWRTKSVSKDAKLQQQVQSLSQSHSAKVPLSASMSQVRLHSSNPNLCAELADFQAPVTRLTDSIDSASDYIKLQEDFCIIAQKVHSLLKSAFNTVAIEKEKIKQVLTEQEQTGQSNQILTLRRSLSQALSQNAELKTRLNRIHSESVLSEQVVSVNIISSPDEAGEPLCVGIPLSQQVSNESRLSMSESVSEFFDAQEVLLSASSSENEASDDESYVSDVSDNISEDNASVTDNVSRQMPNGDLSSGAFRNGRRTCLPAPAPDTSNINLWNILKNNIGKDLSKVSMPVELNEPLNTLQHMCEELEYTELLDKAAQTDDPYERMAIVAAFAVSGYSSTYYRAGSKPFNPLLGETYECIREDKGFCFFSEQVSHHPPISACHCESQNFTFWQDVRWKNKFWGKSMEILPIGTVNVMLPSYGDHYEWNKVTTCVHNILSGRRWIEHYGEVTIKNTRNPTCICKLTFIKGNYWSSNVNEVQGSVMDLEGKVIHRLFGKWHEGLYCGVPPSAKCIWRPGSMPTDYELYYGFSRFAVELNELFPELKELLPPTDARFRPDQRYLEEGNVQMAAAEKQRIEEQQRNRRKWLEENNIKYQPRFFKKVMDSNQRERWVSNNTYWELRKDPGFLKLENPQLW